MKKVLLAGLSLLSVIATKSVSAQTFSFPKDTVRYAVQGAAFAEDIHNDIKNETSGPLTLNWKIISENMPASWDSVFGLCDNVTCYQSGIVGGSTQTTNPIAAGANMLFKVYMDFNTVVPGTYYFTATVTDGAISDTMTFMMTKFNTGVSNTKATIDGVSMYPNPASDELNVLFNPNAGIKNITVYNMIGKAITVYKITAPNSAKLDLQNIPSGIYFIRLTNAQGNVIANRKFTRQ